jgi:hypothetical protein
MFVRDPEGNKLLRDVVVFWQEKAWINGETALESVEKQYKPFCQEEKLDKTLSVWDNLAAQKTDVVLDALNEAGSTTLFGPKNGLATSSATNNTHPHRHPRQAHISGKQWTRTTGLRTTDSWATPMMTGL